MKSGFWFSNALTIAANENCGLNRGVCLAISWAPNGSLFFVNDAYASNEARCYVVDPITLKTTDLAKVIETEDAGMRRFLNAGHSYLRVKRWINSHELLVVLYGHFDDPPPRGFTLQYRIDVNG